MRLNGQWSANRNIIDAIDNQFDHGILTSGNTIGHRVDKLVIPREIRQWDITHGGRRPDQLAICGAIFDTIGKKIAIQFLIAEDNVSSGILFHSNGLIFSLGSLQMEKRVSSAMCVSACRLLDTLSGFSNYH